MPTERAIANPFDPIDGTKDYETVRKVNVFTILAKA